MSGTTNNSQLYAGGWRMHCEVRLISKPSKSSAQVIQNIIAFYKRIISFDPLQQKE
jgi:hypothetical protein